MSATTGVPMVITGLLSVLIGIVCHVFFPIPDANIGAVGLILLGLSLIGAGILLVVAFTVRQRHPSEREKGSVTL